MDEVPLYLHPVVWLLTKEQEAIVDENVEMRCWWECKLVLLQWKTVWWFLITLNIELPFDSVVILQGIYPKELNLEKQLFVCQCA